MVELVEPTSLVVVAKSVLCELPDLSQTRLRATRHMVCDCISRVRRANEFVLTKCACNWCIVSLLEHVSKQEQTTVLLLDVVAAN